MKTETKFLLMSVLVLLSIFAPHTIHYATAQWITSNGTLFGTEQTTGRIGPVSIGPVVSQAPTNGRVMLLVTPQGFKATGTPPPNNIAHLEEGFYGDIQGGGKWIGIGSSPSISVPGGTVDAYGTRTQWGNSYALFNLRSTPTSSPGVRDAVLQWGNNRGRFLLEYADTPTGAAINALGAQYRGVGDVQVGINNGLGISRSEQFVVNGNIYASGLSAISDQRLKERVEPLSEIAVLSKLKLISPKSYYFRENEILNLPKGLQYGFLAQDLEKQFPTLISTGTGSEGYKAVNYLGMVPILVEAVKELDAQQSAQLQDTRAQLLTLQNELRELRSSSKQLPGTQQAPSRSEIALFQNVPNPTEGITRIAYKLPNTVKMAAILVFDFQGKQVKSFDDLKNGEQSVTINAGSLAPGLYYYSLVVDGLEFDTKRMIIR